MLRPNQWVKYIWLKLFTFIRSTWYHITVIICIKNRYLNRATDPGDRGSIPGRVILKTLKMLLDAALLNTQYYKVQIKDKVEQSRERSSALPYTTE